MNDNLLPIGTVVTLKGAQKKLMIIGIVVTDEDSGETFDYMGIPYPEGYIDHETMFLFMGDDIAEIHFLGFVNAEHQVLRAELAKQLNK